MGVEARKHINADFPRGRKTTQTPEAERCQFDTYILFDGSVLVDSPGGVTKNKLHIYSIHLPTGSFLLGTR